MEVAGPGTSRAGTTRSQREEFDPACPLFHHPPDTTERRDPPRPRERANRRRVRRYEEVRCRSGGSIRRFGRRRSGTTGHRPPALVGRPSAARRFRRRAWHASRARIRGGRNRTRRGDFAERGGRRRRRVSLRQKYRAERVPMSTERERERERSTVGTSLPEPPSGPAWGADSTGHMKPRVLRRGQGHLRFLGLAPRVRTRAVGVRGRGRLLSKRRVSMPLASGGLRRRSSTAS